MSQKAYSFCDKKVVVNMANESSKQALSIWTAVPADIRSKILSNVFCGQCQGVVTIADYSLEYYIFNVWLYGDEQCTQAKRIIRKIQIAPTKTLYNFAQVITRAFDFDHCFGFYDNLRDKRNCKKAFELFVDIGEEERPQAKGVKKTKISQAFDGVGEKLIMLFDYGDGWQFNLNWAYPNNFFKD